MSRVKDCEIVDFLDVSSDDEEIFSDEGDYNSSDGVNEMCVCESESDSDCVENNNNCDREVSITVQNVNSVNNKIDHCTNDIFSSSTDSVLSVGPNLAGPSQSQLPTDGKAGCSEDNNKPAKRRKIQVQKKNSSKYTTS